MCSENLTVANFSTLFSRKSRARILCRSSNKLFCPTYIGGRRRSVGPQSMVCGTRTPISSWAAAVVLRRLILVRIPSVKEYQCFLYPTSITTYVEQLCSALKKIESKTLFVYAYKVLARTEIYFSEPGGLVLIPLYLSNMNHAVGFNLNRITPVGRGIRKKKKPSKSLTSEKEDFWAFLMDGSPTSVAPLSSG